MKWKINGWMQLEAQAKFETFLGSSHTSYLGSYSKLGVGAKWEIYLALVQKYSWRSYDVKGTEYKWVGWKNGLYAKKDSTAASVRKVLLEEHVVRADELEAVSQKLQTTQDSVRIAFSEIDTTSQKVSTLENEVALTQTQVMHNLNQIENTQNRMQYIDSKLMASESTIERHTSEVKDIQNSVAALGMVIEDTQLMMIA